jgi:transposase
MNDGGMKVREVTVDAGDVDAVSREIARGKARFGLEAKARVVSCYEAGRDGFWLHRYLVKEGIENRVVDSSSIEVNRRSRRAKSDSLDVRKLLGMLVRYDNGDVNVWRVCRVPTVAEEDARRLHRELERLKKERTGHINRIRALLMLHGCRLSTWRNFLEQLSQLRGRSGDELPTELKGELVREYERLELVKTQVDRLETEQLARLKKPTTDSEHKVLLLTQLCGVGPISAWVFVHELFGWRKFNNRRQLAGAVGLTPTPYQSGDSDREQGVSKSGTPRVRTMMVEIAWGWLRHQPMSKLSRWFEERFGHGKGRMRRVGIVALARRLLIALWQFVENGVVPDGALLKPMQQT